MTEMNKNIIRKCFRGDIIFILWMSIMSFAFPMFTIYNIKMIMFVATLDVLDSFVNKKFKMFISFGCTRKKYYISTLKNSFINSFFLTIVCTILNCWSDGINKSNHVIVLFLFYLTFYILFRSIAIFIEVLSISQYEALEVGMLFFYFVLYVSFILIGPILSWNTAMIIEKFPQYFCVGLGWICFNIIMSIVALKTTEI